MRKESPLEGEGICTRCGTFYKYRDTGGNCSPCHNKAYHEYKAALAARGEEGKKRGIAFWAERGIAVGAKVKTFALSWFGMGGEEVIGTAKVGVNGAYVSAPSHPGKLAPGGWKLA